MSTNKLVNRINESRHSFGVKSVFDFSYKKTRVRQLNEIGEIDKNAKSILYLMTREHRVQDNWTILYAQYLSLKNKLPLYVIHFSLDDKYVSERYQQFLDGGLKKVSAELATLAIPFKAYQHVPNVVDKLSKLVQSQRVGALLLDFFPLKPYKIFEDEIKRSIGNIPVLQVDGHNIVPCWITSDKQEYAARTIRSKLQKHLSEYLTPFPPLIKHPHKATEKFFNSLKKYEINFDQIDDKVTICNWAKPGYEEGISMLEQFIEKKLKNFDSKRNDPCSNCISDLSPWFHFGQISVQQCILVIEQYKSKYPEAVKVFCEEAIIRRELSDNFCYYNDNYDNIDGAAEWAITTLNAHRKDKRDYVYGFEVFETAKTHDQLWNAAQNQLRKHGKMHGFMRMYWAKKILEWSASPEEAIEIAIRLNDFYSLDGHDPNGYVGIMWSICGIHDQGWRERHVFGKIRFMNFDGCKRKFDINKFMKTWN